MISTKFLKSSLVYSIFGALPLASSIILLPFYTNLLSSSDYGTLATFILVSLLIQVVVSFSFESILTVQFFHYKDEPDKLNKFISSLFAVQIAIGIGAVFLSLVIGVPLFQFIFKGKIDFYPFGFMTVITAVCNGIFKTYTYVLISQQKPLRFLWANLFNFVLTIIISVGGLYLYPHTLIGPMYGRLLSGVGILLLALIYISAEFGTAFRKDLLKGVLAFCTPLVVYSIMVWVVSNVSALIILYFSTTSIVALYDFGVKCTLGIDFILSGLVTAIAPKIYSIWKEQNTNQSTKEVNKYYHSASAVALLLIAGTILFVPVVVPFVVKNKYFLQSFVFLPLLSVSFITRIMLMMYIMPINYFKKTHLLPIGFFITALMQLIVSYFAVKYYGIWGAVWAMLLVKPVQLVIMALLSRNVFKFSFNPIKMIYLPLAYAILVIILSHYTTMSNYYIINSISFVAVCVLIYGAYRNEISQLIVFFRKKYL